jgi:cytochrome c-type biogenesis protein CcmH/NrfG
VQHLHSHPRDHDAWLSLARGLWEAGRYPDSLEVYGRVLRAGKLLEEAAADLEVHVRERPSDPAVRQVLGDAYMRSGRLDAALEIYRRTLEKL